MEGNSILYAHRKYVVTINRAEEDGKLLTQFSEYPIRKNELYAVDSFGCAFPIEEENFKKNYVPVKVIDKDKMARGYELMAEINLEESNAGVHTYEDGMSLFKNKPL